MDFLEDSHGEIERFDGIWDFESVFFHEFDDLILIFQNFYHI
jgi:hypothetical protein